MFLVTGANGQLGNELRLLLDEKTALFTDYNTLDITDEKQVRSFFANHTIDLIVNCAAYTAVDKAESDEEKAYEINALGPLNLAQTGVPVIHVSTDYVFDGSSVVPYHENDAPNPQTVYGRTKLAGEKNLFENADTALVIRTAWLYSSFGNNFVKTMMRLGKERDELNVVFDQVGTPTYARDLAQAIVQIIPQIKPNQKEIYHFSNEGVCSWYDFAVKIMEKANLACKVKPIESKDYPTPAMRPHYSVLNKAKIKNDFGIEINQWEKSLDACCAKLL